MSLVEKNVMRILEEGKIPFEITEHEPVYTSEQAARVRDVELKTGVKALVMKTKEGSFILGLCPADKKIDMKKIADIKGTKKVNLASPEEVVRIAGCEIGAVPPFGHKTRLKTYMDKDVLLNEHVNFNIGLHTKSAKILAKDLLDIVKPILFENS